MSENPNNIEYQGLTAPSDELGVAFLIPTQGMMRFVERAEPMSSKTVKVVRILQQYQWSAKLGGFDWFDLPCIKESDL
jgi:hypothetical protein